MKYKIYADALPNIPWEERTNSVEDGPVWRSSKNPIIKRNILPKGNSVFNSAAVPFNGKFAGVFRVDDKERRLRLHRGFSDDGMNWKLDPTPISLIGKDGTKTKVLGYDARVVRIVYTVTA